MKFAKKLTTEGRSLNEFYVSIMERLHAGKDTVSVKKIESISGPKAERDEAIALARIACKSLSERGDKTFIFSKEFLDEDDNYERLLAIIKRMNRNSAYKLMMLRSNLTDSQKENGKLVAIYNEVHRLLSLSLSDTALTSEEIRDKMEASGYHVEGTLKYESDVKLGAKYKIDPKKEGFKRKEIDGQIYYVCTADTIGAKACPVINDSARNEATNYLTEFENKYEAVMKEWAADEPSDESLLEAMNLIWPEDSTDEADVLVLELSDKDKVKAKQIADELENKIRGNR